MPRAKKSRSRSRSRSRKPRARSQSKSRSRSRRSNAITVRASESVRIATARLSPPLRSSSSGSGGHRSYDYEFEPMTLDILKRNIGKKIYYHFAQGGDPDIDRSSTHPRHESWNGYWENKKRVFGTWFIPTGNLLVKHNGKSVEYVGWLENQSLFHIEPGMYLYATGRLSFDDGSRGGLIGLQISDPMKSGKYKGIRILSNNSMSGNNWVEKGKY